MATDLPYAADAQVSLSYDELEVRDCWTGLACSTQHLHTGPPYPVPERTRPVARHRPDQVQLRMGPREKPCPRAPGGGCPPTTRRVEVSGCVCWWLTTPSPLL